MSLVLSKLCMQSYIIVSKYFRDFNVFSFGLGAGSIGSPWLLRRIGYVDIGL
jgi:hypothetical protein